MRAGRLSVRNDFSENAANTQTTLAIPSGSDPLYQTLNQNSVNSTFTPNNAFNKVRNFKTNESKRVFNSGEAKQKLKLVKGNLVENINKTKFQTERDQEIDRVKLMQTKPGVKATELFWQDLNESIQAMSK